MKHILFATSEAIPFVKTGGLADVAGTLPKYLNRKEYEVRVILPKYMCMAEKWQEQLEYCTHFYLQLGWRRQYVGVLRMQYQGLCFYFVDNEYYFGGERLYSEPCYDMEKFAFFSKAVLEILTVLDWRVDILHCHDWQTGLIPVYLREMGRDREKLWRIRTVLTIHNLKFQGCWELEKGKDVTGLPDGYFTESGLEAYGQVNYLKGGILFADCITTVSASYAKEIQTEEYGEGLAPLMQSKVETLKGILNGLDYEQWNPETDPYLPVCYGKTDVIQGKEANKKLLQQELSLRQKSDVFLLGMVSRLTEQKGFALLQRGLDRLLAGENIQLVILGTGESTYEKYFREAAGRYFGKMAVFIGYSDRLASRIYSACDGFLMPSLFEPCGLSQMIALRYGAIPIVRETGGLRDTIEPYNACEKMGTGFSFAGYDSEEMLCCIWRAFDVFWQEKKVWEKMVFRGMEKDFSWERTAGKYEGIYDELCQEGLR